MANGNARGETELTLNWSSDPEIHLFNAEYASSMSSGLSRLEVETAGLGRGASAKVISAGGWKSWVAVRGADGGC